MKPNRTAVVAAALAAWLAATTASADMTGFLGLSGGPSTRTAWGLAAGVSFLVVGLEFEYADIGESVENLAPRIRTGSGNLLLQTPVIVGGLQVYGTAGAGGYHMNWTGGQEGSDTNVAVNVGGGVKVGLIGPLRLRADYRYFRFMGAAVRYRERPSFLRRREPQVLSRFRTTRIARGIAEGVGWRGVQGRRARRPDYTGGRRSDRWSNPRCPSSSAPRWRSSRPWACRPGRASSMPRAGRGP